MRQSRQELDFDEDLLQPGVIVTYRNTFAGKMAKGDPIEYMPDEEHNPPSASPQLPFFDEKFLEVIRREGSLGDAMSLCRRGRFTAHKLCYRWRCLGGGRGRM